MPFSVGDGRAIVYAEDKQWYTFPMHLMPFMRGSITITNQTKEALFVMSSNSFEASQKRSEAIRADLEVNPGKYTMLTGDRPTGRLHLGHYFGTIKERVALQNKGVTTRVIIADYQVITDRDTTENIQDNVRNMVIDYLACGIDPEKTIIFTHSAIPALNQLMLPFLSLVSEAELLRNPTVKAEQEASGHALTGLLLTYPVHQACDILFCKGNIVPCGKDQLPHIEQTRQIARRFNERYGFVFPEPEGLLNDDAPEIPGLDGRKMSKSYGNAISLSFTAEETAKIIKKSKTDSERFITFDKENRPGVSALLTTAALCTGRTEVEIAKRLATVVRVRSRSMSPKRLTNTLPPSVNAVRLSPQSLVMWKRFCMKAIAKLMKSPMKPWMRFVKLCIWFTRTCPFDVSKRLGTRV